MEKPLSTKTIKILMIAKLSLAILTFVLSVLFLIPGGVIWESFKEGVINGLLQIEASQYSVYHLGLIFGSLFLPFLMSLLAIVAINKKMFKTLLFSVIIQLLLSLTNIFSSIYMIVVIILMFNKKNLIYLKSNKGSETLEF